MIRLTKRQSRSALTILVNPTLTGNILPFNVIHGNMLGSRARTCPIYDAIFHWKLFGRLLFTSTDDDVNLTWRYKNLIMLENKLTL